MTPAVPRGWQERYGRQSLTLTSQTLSPRHRRLMPLKYVGILLAHLGSNHDKECTEPDMRLVKTSGGCEVEQGQKPRAKTQESEGQRLSTYSNLGNSPIRSQNHGFTSIHTSQKQLVMLKWSYYVGSMHACDRKATWANKTVMC